MNNYNFKNKLFVILAVCAIFASFDFRSSGKEADLSKAITDAVQAALKARDIGDDSFVYTPTVGLEMALPTNNDISDKTKAARQASMDTFTEFMVVDDRAKFVSLADKVISSVKEWKATEEELAKTTAPTAPSKEKETPVQMASSSTITSSTPTSTTSSTSTPTSTPATSSSSNPLLSSSSATTTNPLAPSSTTTPSATSSTSSTTTTPPSEQSNQNPLLASSSNPLLPSSPTASSSSNPLLPSTNTSTTDSKAEPKKPEETKTPQESKPEEKKPEEKPSSDGSGDASDSPTGRSLKKLRDRLKQAKGG